MNHTEESLMALVDDFVIDGAYFTRDALRLAIREVLAERESNWILAECSRKRAEKAEAELAFKAALVHELLPYQERAVKAEAELALLKDDNAKWKAGILNMPTKYKRMEFNAQLQRQVKRAEAECERLRKDAERYRWLRPRVGVNTPRDEPAYVWLGCGNTRPVPEKTDAAIDAALKDQQ